PPTASISSAMARALRRSVPLNAICSRKCATPLISGASCRVPTSTQRPIETVSTVSIRSVTMRSPFDSVASVTVMQPPDLAARGGNRDRGVGVDQQSRPAVGLADRRERQRVVDLVRGEQFARPPPALLVGGQGAALAERPQIAGDGGAVAALQLEQQPLEI